MAEAVCRRRGHAVWRAAWLYQASSDKGEAVEPIDREGGPYQITFEPDGNRRWDLCGQRADPTSVSRRAFVQAESKSKA